MLALQRIRDEADAIKEGIRQKGEPTDSIDEILRLDVEARRLRTEVETLRAAQKKASENIRGKPSPEQLTELTGIKQRVQDGDARLTELDQSISSLLGHVANPAHESVPYGEGDVDNVTVATWGTPATFDFEPLPHYDLGETLGIFDFERAVKISGARFAILKGQGARLQRALITWLLDVATLEHGYSEILPPYLVRAEAMFGTANLPKFGDEAFQTTDGMYLVPTAEVPVTNLYSGEILDASQLPAAHVAYSACFRREAGAAGKDTRGYIRLHQFDKVEMVRFTTPEQSMEQFELLTAHAETLLQRLGITYRKLLMCTGDMGFAQWKKYDLEAWAPGMKRWLEVSSCSVFSDFQARRANIRYRPAVGDKPRFVHTINGSGLAIPRTFDAILETFQEKDGSVVIPEVLRPYMGGQERISPV